MSLSENPDYYIVMVEQHYANHVDVLAVCETREDADKIKEDSGLGEDVHIYSGQWNVEYPCV